MWRALDETCRRGVAEGAFPGAVVLAGDGEGVLLHRAYGHRALAPGRLPMTPDTVFDMSSLTKPMATTTAMMLLVRDGRLELDDAVCTVIPEFGRGARAAVTFRQLLNHTSGLPAWKSYYQTVSPVTQAAPEPPPGTRAPRHPTTVSPTSFPVTPASPPVTATSPPVTATSPPVTATSPPVIPASPPVIPAKAGIQQRIHDEELEAPPGEKAVYSDLGFILLGEAVERLSGRPLDRFCRDEIFEPMGLSSTFFADLGRCSPDPRPVPVEAIAATEDCPRRGKILRGEVHDDNAHAMGGVAGHAGVFSSAPDLHRFIRFLGRCRDGAEPGFLPAPLVRDFLEAERTLPGQTHVLGWDTPSPAGSSSGRHFSARTVGHLGFTGTSIWWDLERDLHVVFLTNRVHPSRDSGAIREFRPLVHDAVMEGLSS